MSYCLGCYIRVSYFRKLPGDALSETLHDQKPRGCLPQGFQSLSSSWLTAVRGLASWSSSKNPEPAPCPTSRTRGSPKASRPRTRPAAAQHASPFFQATAPSSSPDAEAFDIRSSYYCPSIDIDPTHQILGSVTLNPQPVSPNYFIPCATTK